MNPEDTYRSEKPRLANLSVLVVAAFLVFWALGNCGLWASEDRWAEVTREMFFRRDFFHPTIGGEPYFDKPLLTYWLVALVSLVSGSLNELAVRLPSAISGVVTILATMRIGARQWSAQTGRIAACVLLSTYGFLFWARTGTAEMENLAVTTLAIAWYWSRRDRPIFVTFQVFYLIIFIGALTKGLTAVVVPVLAVAPDVLRNKRWRALLRQSHLLALALGVAFYLAPFVYASMTRPGNYDASGLELVFRENILRYFKPFDHKGPVYLYLYYVPLLLLPWVPLWTTAVIGTLRIWKTLDYSTRWLIQAATLIFLFYTLSGSRRGYYILPVLPLCALLTAVFVVHLRDRRIDKLQRWGMTAQGALLAAVLLVEFIVPLILLILGSKINVPLPPKLYLASMTIAASALLLAFIGRKALEYSRLRPQVNPTMISAFVMAGTLLGGYFCWQKDILEPYRTKRSFVDELNSLMANLPPENIGLFPEIDAELLFYMHRDKPLRMLSEAADLSDFLETEEPRALITQRRYVPSLLSRVSTGLQQEPDIEEGITSWDSASSRREKWVVWLLGNRATDGIPIVWSKQGTSNER